ncbi:MAG TPA: DUF3267 domain-containing protein, partial [Bacillota bacterium]|nr:DUF3267 domain-containing protein [Bacillota bacterium]
IMVLAIALPIALVFIILFYMVNPIVDFWKINISLLIFPAYLIGIVAHELIHGLTWAYFCKTKWKAIGFGVIWKYLTPYCTCNEPLSYKAYITGGLMPTIILGLVPYIISLLIASEFLLFFSLLLIIGGGGDMYMVMIMRKYKNAIFVDHPYEVGCTAFERD